MFFNLETGTLDSNPIPYTDIHCWLANNDIWISNNKGEVCISSLDIERLAEFIDSASGRSEYMEIEVRGLRIVLEDEDEGDRNLCFWSNNLFVSFNLPVKHLPAFANFLREQIKQG